jgi:hypothetical protein
MALVIPFALSISKPFSGSLWHMDYQFNGVYLHNKAITHKSIENRYFGFCLCDLTIQ